MHAGGRVTPRSQLARAGFVDLSEATHALDELTELTGAPRDELVAGAARSADPDGAVRGLVQVARRRPEPVRAVLADAAAPRILWRLFGASQGIAAFYLRHPEHLADLIGMEPALP